MCLDVKPSDRDEACAKEGSESSSSGYEEDYSGSGGIDIDLLEDISGSARYKQRNSKVVFSN